MLSSSTLRARRVCDAKAFKYRIYLTNGQRRILEQQLEECRWVYNQTLAARRRCL